MRNLKKGLFVPLLLLTTFLYSQNNTLGGKVISSADNLPLSGATISLKGTNRSTVSSSDGSFTLRGLSNQGTLVVSYTGYQIREVAVKSGDMNITVALEQSSNSMDEVVVVGYGSQSRKSLTGAIGRVRGEDIQKLPTQRVDQALQGRVAGVSVVNTEGSPGGNTTIRIRGLNSINGNNGPLIVIDGAQGGDLNLLNPSDIESVDVLKDASATAIYGSRGANGVILVTTRLGKTAKPIVTYSFDHGIQNITKYLDVMTAGEFARFTNKVALSDNGSGRNPQPIFTQQEIDEYDKNGGSDMQRAIFKTGIMNNHQLSVSGGGDKLRYLISGSLLDQSGVLLKSRYKRASLRTNLTATINNWVKFGVNAYYVDDKYMSPPFGREAVFLGHAINRAPLWPATERAYDDNGNYWVHRTGKGAILTPLIL
jgi:TonB-linked SusC/RagA family outer membrane protein